MNNIITAVFGGRREARTAALFQWDYGIILQLIGPALPVAYEVHFSASQTGEAAVVIGDEDGVAIPDEYLTTAGTLYAWVYLHTGDSDGETRYTVTIPVTPRAKPSDYQPTPVEQGVIQQAIAALTAGVAAVEEAVENVDQTVADALQEAKDSGEFDGPKGDPGDPGERGPKGDTGDPGPAGVGVPVGGDSGQVLAKASDDDYDTEWVDMQGGSAVSPTATVVKVGDTATITITDYEGTTTASISDGERGPAGPQGVPGERGETGQTGTTGATGNGIASIAKTGTSGLVDTYTITYTDGGTTTYTVTNGAQGQPGPQGEPGADYVLTAQDKADIADIVLGELPVYNGGVI